MATDPIASKLRAAFPDYQPTKLEGEDLEYLEELALPPELASFFEANAPAETIGSGTRLLSISEMREEHDEGMEPGATVRAAGACVLATANGNPYFVFKSKKSKSGYEIRLLEGDEVEEEAPLKALIKQSSQGPAFTSFAEFIDALIANVLPASPYQGAAAMKKLEDWRRSR